MSIYAHLPIYNSSFQLLKYFHEKIPKFSKQYKYILGEKILECLIESIILIGEICNTKDKERKTSCVFKIIENTNRVLIHTRIANELHQLGGENAYFFLSEKILKILDQAENWKKFLQKGDCPQNYSFVNEEVREKECHLPLPNLFEFN